MWEGQFGGSRTILLASGDSNREDGEMWVDHGHVLKVDLANG